MKKDHLLPGWARRALDRLPAGLLTAALLVCGFPLLQAQAAPASGGPDVVITAINATHSTGGAEASARMDGNSAVVLQASLPSSGAWAYYTVTLENQGGQPAALAQTLENAQLPQQLDLSFDLSGLEGDQTLQPGEQCTASILVQADQQDLSPTTSAGQDFALTLVYDATPSQKGDTSQSGSASGISAPQTADGTAPLLAGGTLLCSALGLMLLRRRRG